eukprot:12784261-Alexandrium_andersonii.AAC.1
MAARCGPASPLLPGLSPLWGIRRLTRLATAPLVGMSSATAAQGRGEGRGAFRHRTPDPAGRP